MEYELILGSQSPRRQQILRDSGYPFRILTTDMDEIVDPDMDVYAVPEALAIQKGQHIYPRISNNNYIVMTADTVVILNGRIIGKPRNMDEARSFLESLSGSTHEVVSGVSFYTAQDHRSFSDTTSVTFETLTENEIEHYLKHYKVMDKAGAYAIQEWIGLIGISSIEGSYYNVMGLPMHKVHRLLREFGLSPVSPP